jgi:RNA polymerase-binding transcription factor DksA
MATKKKAAKPAAKKSAKPAPKKVAKPAAKKAAKPVAKKAIKPAVKKVVSAKPTPKKAAKVVMPVKSKPMPKPVAKKPEVIKHVVAPVVKPKLETNIKPSVKQAIKELKKEAKKPVPVKEIKPIKTSVSTSVRYQPDFTKSVLDKPVEEKQQGPLVKYSDAELAEFKELIQRKLEAAKKELTYLHGLITRKDDLGGDGDDGRYMTMEDGSISMEREQLSQMASRQITYIDHLEKALMRIENKTYGICRVTGKLIDKARLRAVPHATLSMDAKMGLVKGPHINGE